MVDSWVAETVQKKADLMAVSRVKKSAAELVFVLVASTVD